jgi:hypothetical protein
LDSDSNAGMLGNIWILWSLFVVFNGLDNYPALLRLPKVLGPVERGLERTFTHAVLIIVSILGWFVGLRKQYPEYTPER